MVWGHPHISTSVDTHQLYETEFSDITTGGFDYKTVIAETLNVVFTYKFVAWGVEPEYHFSIVCSFKHQKLPAVRSVNVSQYVHTTLEEIDFFMC